jgi:nitrous oxide reductase accessory protein NosL
VKFVAAVIVLTLSAACSNTPTEAPPAATAPVADPATVATVTGQVVLEGTAPTMQVIRLDGDPKCVALAAGEERRTENVIVGPDNTLQNAFVYVKDGLPPGLYPVPSAPVVLDQQKCRYVPHVVGVQVGQSLAIRNSDPLLHNVRSDGLVNQPFDVGTPLQGIEIKRTFATREVMVPFKCNVHAWMTAYVGVLEHPFFAVTDASGRFSIPSLPPGTYTLEVWHETFGTQTQQVTVAAKDRKDLTFTYKAP